VQGICVIAFNEELAPNKMKLYINKENADFSIVED
jgi:hypothetical protein